LGVTNGELPAETDWVIEDILLGYLRNELSFLAVDNDGVLYSDRVFIYNFNTGLLDNADDDGDGMANWEEDYIGTDKSDPDTDGDGISDGIENNEISSDPLVFDSGRDLDMDGLTSLQEIQIGTDPWRADSDGDRLKDDEELSYNTDPLNPDTDADGFNDTDEISLGLDPCNPISNGAVPDARRTYTRKISEKVFVEVLFSENNKAVPHITLTTKGVPDRQIEVSHNSNNTLRGNAHIIGYVIDIDLSDLVESGTLAFELISPRPLNEIVICRYISETKDIIPIKTTLDASGYPSAALDGSGTYLLLERRGLIRPYWD
jgi:hypothetical protein